MTGHPRLRVKGPDCLEAVRRYAEELNEQLSATVTLAEAEAADDVDFDSGESGIHELQVEWKAREQAGPAAGAEWEAEGDADNVEGIDAGGGLSPLALHQYQRNLEALAASRELAASFLTHFGRGVPGQTRSGKRRANRSRKEAL